MKNKLILILIIFIGILLRFYMLGSNPASLDWDEASQGYNAYSIYHTGKDEYGNFLPLSIESFGDYKPPMYTYLTIPSVAIFGLTEFAVRLPSAIFGTIAIWLTYLLVFEIFSSLNDKKKAKWIALLAAFFFAVSPWSLQFSRTAFEANVGITWTIAGLLTLFYGLKKPQWLLLSALCFTGSMYSYHSFRLIDPLLLICTVFIFWENVLQYKGYAITFFVLFSFLCLPIFFSLFSTTQGTGARLDMVTIFGSNDILQQSSQTLTYDRQHHDLIGEIVDNRRFVYALAIVQGYLSHFNPDFLFFHGDGGEQHHPIDMGMLYLWDLPFLLIGLYFFFYNMSRKKLLIILLFLLAPLPSAIATDPPHAVRAIAMIPVLQIFIAVGVYVVYLFLSRYKKSIFWFSSIVILLLFIFNFVYYLHQYYIDTPAFYASGWQYGYKEVIAYAKQHEDQYSHIVITYTYDQPYIYYLFYNKIDPRWYQNEWLTTTSKTAGRMNRDIGKYSFRNIDWGKDKNMKNTLIIGVPNEIPVNAPYLSKIYYPDNSVAFVITHT